MVTASIIKRNFTHMTVEQVINHLSDNEYTLYELRNEVMSML